jgi:endonuclease/exonuclease/phosphatase family metal-dependent hydrolase
MKRMIWSFVRAVIATFALLTLVACALHVTHTESDSAPAPPQDGALRIASHNVHYIVLGQQTGPWSVGGWDRRKRALDMSFKTLQADIVAFQEMESFQRGSDGSINLARDYLVDRNPGYDVAATGDWRDFPTTQPMFYRTDRLQLVDQGWFFFSRTPDVIYSPTFNGSYPAFASWSRFEDRDTTALLRVVNLHFEYSSRSNRLKSAALVRDRVRPWIDAGETVFIVGDLNALHGTRTMDILENAGVIFDRTPGATYHLNRGLHLFGAIDHLSRTRDVALAAGPFVLQRKFDDVWPSDHHPVYADYLMTSDAE